MPKLTNNIDAIRHSGRIVGREYYWSDNGLALIVTKAQGKTWYRRFKRLGKLYWYKIGDWPDMPLKVAIKKNDELTAKLLLGINPTAERHKNRLESAAIIKARDARVTFAEAADAYHADKTKTVTKGYAANIRCWIKKANKVIGRMEVKDITIVELKKALKTVDGTPRVARLSLWLIKDIIRLAHVHGMTPVDNVASIKVKDIFGAPPTTKHQPSIAEQGTVKDFQQFLKVVEVEVSRGLSVATLVKAVIYLPVRKNEMMQIKWGNIDFESNLLRIYPEHNKRRYEIVQPISRQLREIFLLQQARYPGCDHVFPNRDDIKGGAVSLPSTTKFIEKIGYKQKQSIHGLRSCWKTWATSVLYLPWEVTEMTLAHEVRNQVGKAYDFNQFMDIRRIGLQKWADWIDSLIANP